MEKDKNVKGTEDWAIKYLLTRWGTAGLIKIITSKVIEVRAELAEKYPLSEGSTCDLYTGLCDTAVNLLFDKMRELDEVYQMGIICSSKHGEMAHNPICPSDCWPAQHTWGTIKKDDVIIYVDPTASQFKDLYKDIPDFYVSTEPPKWYYDDRKNPAFNGITRWINEHVEFRRKVRVAEEDHYVNDGIINFLQYDVWGRISDAIRLHRMKHQA